MAWNDVVLSIPEDLRRDAPFTGEENEDGTFTVQIPDELIDIVDQHGQ